jgi:hypothetical protein
MVQSFGNGFEPEKPERSNDSPKSFSEDFSAGPTAGLSPQSLFVFGSFSEGMVHFNKIAPYVDSLRPATIYGSLLRCPSGLIVLDVDGAETVQGEIVTLKKSEFLFALLDSFHGVRLDLPEDGLFFRNQATAVLDCGATEITTAYYMNPRKIPRGSVRVEDANWKRSFLDQPPLYARLSERQKSYIQKLGASSGRDIVPIDLGLYRELMQMEIVIDKGRRLALSSLGQDLYRLLC